MAKKESTKTAVIESKPVCGIIMPISAIDGCSSEHWAEVKKKDISAIENSLSQQPTTYENKYSL